MFSIFALQPIFAVPAYLLLGFILSLYRIKEPQRLRGLLADFVFFCSLDSLFAFFIWYPVFDNFNKVVFWCWTSASVFAFIFFSTFKGSNTKPNNLMPEDASTKPESFQDGNQERIILDESYFLTDEIEKIISNKSPRLLIVGPYGAGKETVATLNARRHSGSILVQRPSLTLQDFSHFQKLLKEDSCLIFLDIQSYSQDQLNKLSGLCFQISGRIILTSIRVFEEKEFPAACLFDVEFIPALKPEQVEACFAHFCKQKLEEVKWEGFADLTKLLYPPMVKEIAALAQEEAELKDEQVISRESLASALTKFLNKPV